MITQVLTHRVEAPLHTPFVTALRRTGTVRTLIVEVRDGDGHRGFGEGPQVLQVTGASVEGTEACVAQVMGPLLVGRDPDELTANCRAVRTAVAGNEAAKAALDIALHDLAAQRLGIPLVRLLGGTALRVPTDVTLSADEAADAAAARVADGFGVLKVKVGADPATDVARVRAVRQAAGPDVTIRVDANQAWTPRQAVGVIRALHDEGLNLELVEQPVPAWDLDGMAWVRDRVDLPILADESVFGVRDLVEVIRRGAADLVNVKLAKCGGLSAGRVLLRLAEEHGVGTMVGSMMESPVGVGAAASLVAACGTTLTSDLDAAWWLARSPVEGGIGYDGPVVVLPDAPGLGVTGIADNTVEV
ncbi:dipeptide epimerase [Rugosimonospora acidiphila]|uniref:Dipeptide epimerase n=1 Tax=Rugosimonospora acidiphila TaxID=556531 RepID=A0ABP9RMR5_9ACTN